MRPPEHQEHDRQTPRLHIAVGVLIDAQGRVLIARRRPGTPGAGKWEFPGGKREAGESIESALTRELREELGVAPRAARPLIRFSHAYSDRSVLLDVWRIEDWSGTAAGLEGQPLAWCEAARLFDYDLLSANKPIVDAIRLPTRYLITPEPDADRAGFLRRAESALAGGMRMLRLRAPNLDDDAYEDLAGELQIRAQKYGADLLLDRDAAMAERIGAAGLHWPATAMAAGRQRPLPTDRWFALSCHNRQELEGALEMGADFASLSPVAATPSHPRAQPLGWEGLAAARAGLPLPVYALGGTSSAELETAWRHGAQGVAGIRAFWPSRAATV